MKRAPRVRHCVWREQACGEYWLATCGLAWSFEGGAGTPTGNGMQYCPKCGRPLREARAGK